MTQTLPLAAELPIVLIPCGGAKLDRRAPAGELYVGAQFRLALKAALALTEPELVRIVSARHGILRLAEEIEPYDVKLGTGSIDEICPTKLRLQVEPLVANGRRIVSLLPAAYHELVRSSTVTLRALWPHGIAPSLLEGSRGIGDQRAILSRIAKGEFTLDDVLAGYEWWTAKAVPVARETMLSVAGTRGVDLQTAVRAAIAEATATIEELPLPVEGLS